MRLVIAEKKSVATAIAQALCAAPVQRTDAMSAASCS